MDGRRQQRGATAIVGEGIYTVVGQQPPFQPLFQP